MEKDKKNTYNIFWFKKKIDTSSISTSGKKSFSVEKKNLLDIISQLVNPHQLPI